MQNTIRLTNKWHKSALSAEITFIAAALFYNIRHHFNAQSVDNSS